MKGWEEKIRKDHIKAFDKGDLVLIIFDHAPKNDLLRSKIIKKMI
jgi:hypothetical protein